MCEFGGRSYPVDTYERPCAGCGRPIKRSRRHSYCGDKCRLDARRPGPRRFAYADPPYPGNSARLYGHHPDFAGEVDHARLVARLVDEFPDGWALSTGSTNLHEVLPLCPADVRVMAWTKPLLSIKPTVSVQYGWEPLLVHRGRPRSSSRAFVRDYLSCSPTRHKQIGGLIGMKPQGFCYWLFEVLGALPGDELVDVFPGSGAVGEAWRAWCAQPQLGVEPIEAVG